MQRALIRNISWNAIEKFGGKFLSLLVSVILARLLSPAEFGIIAILLVFTQLATVIQDSGFSQALIKETKITNILCNSFC